MIHLYKNTTPTIFVTPSENTDVIYPYFYFKFTCRVTQNVVELWLEDDSTTQRVQEFVIDVDDNFENENSGLWSYEIKGATDYPHNNIEPGYSAVLESGYMYLHDATTFAPTEYNGQDNQFITYNGQ
jgi:hypothetical protein